MLRNFDEILTSSSPIIFIFGEESFLLEEAVLKIINKHFPNKKNYYDFELLDGSELNESILVDRCSAYPMISEKRLVILKNAEKLFTGKSKKAEKNSVLARYLDKPSESTILVIVANIDTFSGISAGLKGKNKAKYEKMIEQAKFPYNVLLSKYDWIEFPKLYDNQIPRWIKERFKNYGKKISDEAAQLLFANSNGELHNIANEIEKICLYVNGRSDISTEDIANVSGNNRLNNIFELQKAIGEKNISKANEILFNMLENDRQEMLIITMLTRYFIALWKIQELMNKTQDKKELAKEIGVNEYFINDYILPAKLYSKESTEKALIALCEADFELKSSGGDNLLTMQNLLEKIISSN